MKRIFAVAIVLLLGLAAFLFWWTMQSAPPVAKPVAVEPRPQQVPEAQVDYPVERKSPVSEEPTEDSEPAEGSTIDEILAWLFDGMAYERYLIPDNFIQRFVILVDNLPRDRLPSAHLPTRPVQGEFLSRRDDDDLIIDPANSRRYDPFLRLVEGVDPERAVAVYVRLYPRFQRAYEQLGYQGYFNDRLVAVIDHLLATPRIDHPIRLRRPKVRYIYADPRIEAMSAGRKLMIRTGPENMVRIKTLLGDYREHLVGLREEG